MQFQISISNYCVTYYDIAYLILDLKVDEVYNRSQFIIQLYKCKSVEHMIVTLGLGLVHSDGLYSRLAYIADWPKYRHGHC